MGNFIGDQMCTNMEELLFAIGDYVKNLTEEKCASFIARLPKVLLITPTKILFSLIFI